MPGRRNAAHVPKHWLTNLAPSLPVLRDPPLLSSRRVCVDESFLRELLEPLKIFAACTFRCPEEQALHAHLLQVVAEAQSHPAIVERDVVGQQLSFFSADQGARLRPDQLAP